MQKELTHEQFDKLLEELFVKFAGTHEDYWVIDYSKRKESKSCGVYSIRIDDFRSFSEYATLPEHDRICQHADQYSKVEKNVIYIGEGKNVRNRCLYQELCGDIREGKKKQRATFYRKLGSVLGFVPPEKTKYFQFDEMDNKKILNWIQSHLRVKYIDLPKGFFGTFANSRPKPFHNALQDELIIRFKPVFNGPPNDPKCVEISELVRANKQ